MLFEKDKATVLCQHWIDALRNLLKLRDLFSLRKQLPPLLIIFKWVIKMKKYNLLIIILLVVLGTIFVAIYLVMAGIITSDYRVETVHPRTSLEQRNAIFKSDITETCWTSLSVT